MVKQERLEDKGIGDELMEMQEILWPIKRLRVKDFAIDMLFEYEDDDGSTLVWGQGRVVAFIKESIDKHVFVKIESSDKCMRDGDLKITRYHKYARVGTYVPYTNTRMICCVHACTGTGTNTANLSKPTACMNRSIASTLPKTWQDINNSLDPTTASNWRLSSIKRYNLESRPSTPPLPSQPSSFH